MSDEPGGGFTRRDLVRGTLVGAVAAGVAGKLPAAGDERLGPGPAPLELKVNGEVHRLSVEPRVTLVDALRDRLGLTGTKVVCGRGACGACTVLVEGEAVCSCLMLAHEVAGRDVTTIEGLASDGRLTPIQEAFIAADALQCGFCTSGMVISCKLLLDRVPRPDRSQIREAVSGNLCRCGTYPHVIDAVEMAAGRRPGTVNRELETDKTLAVGSRFPLHDSRLRDDARVAAATRQALEDEGQA